MNLALVDVMIGTALAVYAGILFTVWRFHSRRAHDSATTRLLKQFFDGKACAICKRPIPALHGTGLKPGLLNPETHEARWWDEIPKGDLSAALETQLPICPSCAVAESFRQRFPDRIVDGDRPLQQARAHDRLEAESGGT